MPLPEETLPTPESPAALRVDPPQLSPGQKLKKALGPVGSLLVVAFGFLGKLKALALPLLKLFPVLLKTGGTMLFSIWFYAMNWGWPYAVGFVVLIFIHECGHLVVARRFGLKVGAPVFLPFMGAFIALKDAPKNALMEAWVGIGGPLFGAAGAAVCELIAQTTGAPLFRALAYSGFFLNLFNLMPIGFLDDGRIVTVLSPWLWIVGLAVAIFMTFQHLNFIVLMIIVSSLPRVWSLFRAKTDEEKRYFEVTTYQRWNMGLLYFGLIALLVGGMAATHIAPPRR